MKCLLTIPGINIPLTIPGINIPITPGMLIPGIVNEMFIKDLADKVALSAGSACGISEPSYIIKEINQQTRSSNFIRLALDKFISHNLLKEADF